MRENDVNEGETSISRLLIYFNKKSNSYCYVKIKGALSDLTRFLATESPLKMTKNAFYFT